MGYGQRPYGTSPYGESGFGQDVNVRRSIFRSHVTQELLNYFDEKDSRVREIPFTLDAQLLNAAAQSIERMGLRLQREVDGMALSTCPSNIDNRGLYWAVQGVLSTPNKVEVLRDGNWLVLQEYADRIPAPVRYLDDVTRPIVNMTDPVLFDEPGQDLIVQGPFTLDIPNRLSFWLEDVPTSFLLDVMINGEVYPVSPWANQRVQTTESLQISNAGQFRSRRVWKNISSIVVRGLPEGARLRCYQIEFNFPMMIDEFRPFSHAAFRDVLFPRYWQVAGGAVKEMYLADNVTGFEEVETYQSSSPIIDLAVEQNTYGMMAATNHSLLYYDRRQVLPDKLSATALKREPLYGLDCYYDVAQSTGAARFLTMRPVPYARASEIQRWRIVVTDPAGTVSVLIPDGTFLNYAGGVGWQFGVPVTLSMPLVRTGTYVITLETVDGSGQTASDTFPFLNAELLVREFDMSEMVPQIKGVAFDAFQQLWIWTGSFVVPLRPELRGYVYDSDSQAIFLTEEYEQVRYE